jgi:hypothetical protein
MPNQTARLLAGWDPYNQNTHAEFFDPEWMFSLDAKDFSGFDIVIGNPPYVRQEQIKELKPGFKQHYQCFTGTADLYVYFYERGIQLLKTGGVFSFITSNKWFRSGYGEKLRAWLKKNTRVRRLIDFGDAEIFDAIAYPCIAILSKQVPPEDSSFQALSWNLEWKVAEVRAHLSGDTFAMPQKDLSPEAWRLESGTRLRLIDRIKAAGTPLGEYVKGRFYYGIKTGLNDAFVVTREKRDELIAAHPSSADVLKPFLRGRDVKRWRVEFAEKYLIRIESSENMQHPWSGKSDAQAEKVFAQAYSAIYAFMKPMRQEMIARCDQGKYFWELRSCAYWEAFDQPKIVVPAITDAVNYAPDTANYYSNDKTSIVLPDSVPYTLAILNSQVSWYLTQQTFASKQGGFFEFKPMYFSQLTIPGATPRQQQLVEGLSEILIYLHSRPEGQTAMSAYFERLLNGLVYELFFESDLHAEKLTFFAHLDGANPPKLAGIAKSQRIARITEFHAQIADVSHPLYACLFALNGLEVVRIIEGKA